MKVDAKMLFSAVSRTMQEFGGEGVKSKSIVREDIAQSDLRWRYSHRI